MNAFVECLNDFLTHYLEVLVLKLLFISKMSNKSKFNYNEKQKQRRKYSTTCPVIKGNQEQQQKQIS